MEERAGGNIVAERNWSVIWHISPLELTLHSWLWEVCHVVSHSVFVLRHYGAAREN
jgi:hypothetical protein